MFKIPETEPEVFEFEFEGETYSIPAVSALGINRFRKIRKALKASSNQSETMFDELMSVFDEYIPEAMEKMTMGQATALFREYARATNGNASLGES